MNTQLIIQIVILSLIAVLCVGIYIKTKNNIALFAIVVEAVFVAGFYLLKWHRERHHKQQHQ